MLTECQFCSGQVAKSAVFCPHCGGKAPVKGLPADTLIYHGWLSNIGWVVVVLAAFKVLFLGVDF